MENKDKDTLPKRHEIIENWKDQYIEKCIERLNEEEKYMENFCININVEQIMTFLEKKSKK